MGLGFWDLEFKGCRIWDVRGERFRVVFRELRIVWAR